MDWGLSKKRNERAFRTDMAMKSGELSGLCGKTVLMTATATRKTIRLIQNELFPEVNTWKLVLNPPIRKNCTLLMPPPWFFSASFETTLAPFIARMKELNEVYLIIVRGKI